MSIPTVLSVTLAVLHLCFTFMFSCVEPIFFHFVLLLNEKKKFSCTCGMDCMATNHCCLTKFQHFNTADHTSPAPFYFYFK